MEAQQPSSPDCSLPPEGLAERLAWIQRELIPHATATERLDDGVALELADDPGVREKLDRLIALEAQCCTSLTLSQGPGATPRGRRLEVRGLAPDAPLLAELGLPPANPASRHARLAKAVGAGVTGSLLVCCVLPMAAGALVGAAAAPLAALDGPVPIALGAAVGGAATWRWLGRRSER